MYKTQTISAVLASVTVPLNVDDNVFEFIARQMADEFGGSTITSQSGLYIRQDDGTLDEDGSYKLESWVPRSKVKGGQAFVRGLAQQVLANSDEEAVLWSFGGVAYLEMRD